MLSVFADLIARLPRFSRIFTFMTEYRQWLTCMLTIRFQFKTPSLTFGAF